MALDIVRRASLNCYIFEGAENDSLESKTSLFQQKFGGAIEVRMA